jgi:hypothetical protein
MQLESFSNLAATIVSEMTVGPVTGLGFPSNVTSA